MKITDLRAVMGFFVSSAMLLAAAPAGAYCGGGVTPAPSAPPTAVGPGSGSTEESTDRVTTQAGAEDPAIVKARTHFLAGDKAYNAADYQTAAREFKAAEALTPKIASPVLARQLGQINEKLHRPRVAIKYYHRFIAQRSSGTEADEVNARIATLESEVGSGNPTAAEMAEMPPSTDGGWIGYDPFDGASAKTKVVTRHAMPKYWWVGLVTVAGSALVVGLSVGLTHRDDERLPTQGQAAALTVHF